MATFCTWIADVLRARSAVAKDAVCSPDVVVNPFCERTTTSVWKMCFSFTKFAEIFVQFIVYGKDLKKRWSQGTTARIGILHSFFGAVCICKSKSELKLNKLCGICFYYCRLTTVV